MALSVEDALRRTRNQVIMLSWVMGMAERENRERGQVPQQLALEGVSDLCDELGDLVDRVIASFGGRDLSTDLVEWADDEEETEDDETDDEEGDEQRDNKDVPRDAPSAFQKEIVRLRDAVGDLTEAVDALALTQVGAPVRHEDGKRDHDKA